MSLDFVFIRYGKRTDTETAFERRVYYSQFSKGRGIPRRATCGSTRANQMMAGVRGKYGQKPVLRFSGEEMGEAG